VHPHRAVTAQVTQLRRDLTISSVLANFVSQVDPLGPRAASIAAEVVSGIKVYFNTHCGASLLYDIEQPQLAELKKDHPDVDLCDV
jgi:hypothetical protein